MTESAAGVIASVQWLLNSEWLSARCQLGMHGCTGTGSAGLEPYLEQVEEEQVVVVACEACLVERAQDI